MKKIILIALMLVAAHFGFSQTLYSYYYTSDSSIVQVTNKRESKFTGKYFYAADGGVYPIMMSYTGHFYIDRKSKKTGKIYRQYL